MSASSPYPRRNGKYVIDCSIMPEELKQALDDARRMDFAAKESWRFAERWERDGVGQFLIHSRRKLAAAYERCRYVHLIRLWTFHGKEPPPGIGLDSLDITGEGSGERPQGGGPGPGRRRRSGQQASALTSNLI